MLLRRDATVLRLAARTAERRVAGASEFGVRALAEELIVSMDHELDYLREATMCDRLRQAVAHDDPADDVIRVPQVFHELCTDRLLVMEEAPGRPIDAPGAIAASGAPPHLLASALLSSFLVQVLQGMVFHADPHPGNLMVDRGAGCGCSDYGAVGLLDPVTRRALQDIAVGMSAREPLVVARAVRHLAGADATADLSSPRSDIGILMVESAGGFDPAGHPEVLTVMSRHGLKVPRVDDLTVEGAADPGRDPPGDRPDLRAGPEATAAADALATRDPDMTGDLLQQELRRSMPVLRILPEHIDELATQLRSGSAAGPDRAVRRAATSRWSAGGSTGSWSPCSARWACWPPASSWSPPNWPGPTTSGSPCRPSASSVWCSRRSSSCGPWPRRSGGSGPRG